VIFIIESPETGFEALQSAVEGIDALEDLDELLGELIGCAIAEGLGVFESFDALGEFGVGHGCAWEGVAAVASRRDTLASGPRGD
jgi:hypothetical protein